MENNDRSVSQNRVFPPYRFFFIYSFIVLFAFLVLDFIFRSTTFFLQSTFAGVVINVLYMITLAVPVAAISAGVLQCMEYLVTQMAGRIVSASAKSPNPDAGKNATDTASYGYHPGDFTIFLLYLVFAYINLLYFKFQVMSYSSLRESSVHTWLVIPLVVLILGVLFFYYKRRKSLFTYEKLAPFAVGITKPLVICLVLCIIASLSLFFIYATPGKNIAGKSLNAEKTEKKNLIIVTFDSLSAQNLALYGYHRKTTPNIDKLASQSYVFNRMHANCNTTAECLFAMLGCYPRPSDKHVTTSFVTELKKNGYLSRTFLSAAYNYRKFYTDFSEFTTMRSIETKPLIKFLMKGRNRGNFWWMTHLMSEKGRFYNLFYLIDPRSANYISEEPCPVKEYFDYALQKLRTEPGPVFTWVFVFEPHFPYLLPPGFKDYVGTANPDYEPTQLAKIESKSELRKLLLDRYDSNIRYVDEEFGRFVEQLKQEGYYDNSILVVTADHGECFGEYNDGVKETGFFGHGNHMLNEQMIHIPLIIHLPGQTTEKRVDTFAEQVDLAPTLLDLLHIPKPAWLEGESLVPYMEKNVLSKKNKDFLPCNFLLSTSSGLSPSTQK